MTALLLLLAPGYYGARICLFVYALLCLEPHILCQTAASPLSTLY